MFSHLFRLRAVPASPSPTGRTVALAALWPAAIVLVLHRVLIRALNGAVTDDFTTVYSAVRRMIDGVAVYSENYSTVDPHYLYNPGATLLLAPMGLSDNFELSRAVFIAVNAAAIIAALALSVRLVGHKLSGWLFPASVGVAFLSETVINTLVFTNINGVMFLAFAAFLSLFLSGHTWWAGIVLGLAVVVKPMMAPVLLLPLLKLDWRSLVGGIGIPVIANVAAWPLVPGAADYLTVVVPYLSETRDYANSSLAGFAIYFGMPWWMETILWLLLAAFVGVGVVALFFYRDSDPVFWSTTTAGLLLTGVFVLSSLGQQYYSMLLFPMMLTAVRQISVFHLWPAWLAAVLILLPDDWHSSYFPTASRWLSYFVATLGWSMLIIVIAVASIIFLRRDLIRNSASDGSVTPIDNLSSKGDTTDG